MPAPPSMKYCPECNAPNPQARTECFACKQSLDKKAVPPAPPNSESSERTYFCTNCGQPLPFAAALFCTACGQPASPPTENAAPPFSPETTPTETPAPAPPPATTPPTGAGRVPRTPLPGWAAEPLPNGMVQLRRTTGGRFLRDAWLPGLLIGAFAFSAAKFLFRGSDTGIAAAVLWGGLAFLTLGGTIVVLVWAFASQEELLIGPKTLQHRQFLGSYEKTWLVDGQAALRIETVKEGKEWSRHGTKTTRTLYAEHGAQSHVVDRRTGDASQYGMKFRTISGVLSDAMGGANWGDEMVLIGRYLSEQIGWPLTDDRPTSATR